MNNSGSPSKKPGIIETFQGPVESRIFLSVMVHLRSKHLIPTNFYPPNVKEKVPESTRIKGYLNFSGSFR